MDDAAASATLDALPVAVAVFDDAGNARWCNRTLRLLADQKGDDNAVNRLLGAMAASDAVAAARQSGKPAAASARLPTDRGLLDREVAAVPIEVAGATAVVASFASAATLGSAALELDEVTARVEAMLEHTADLITVLDADGTIRFSNAAAGRVTGFSGGQVNGLNAVDLVHPEDVERVAIALAEAMTTEGVASPIEFRLRFADGTWHDVEALVNNLLGTQPIDGLVVTVHDLTERKRSAAWARSIVENLTDVIVILDANFEVTYVSPAISRLIHAPPETNIGMSAFNDVHPDDLSRVDETLSGLAAAPPGSTVSVDFRLESRPGSGNWRWVEATAVNRLDDPAVAGMICTLRDVTEQRALERLKDDFLATVSHELRTPLATIMGFADLLRREAVDVDLRADLLGRIVNNAEDMRSMVDNLLDFSALEAGKVTAREARLGVRDTVTNAIETVGNHLARHHVEVNIADELVVLADPHGFGHVLRNLLTNAVNYSEAGTSITISAARDDDVIRIEVRDEGIGIPEDQQQLVFERFFRSNGAVFAGRGTGIGLNIVRRYVDLMNGKVGVTSAPGEGSTFWVDLPAAPRAGRIAGTG